MPFGANSMARTPLQKRNLIIFVSVFALTAFFFSSIRTSRNDFPEDDDGPCKQSIGNGVDVFCWLRINPHGWPLTTFEVYRHRWFAHSWDPPQRYAVTATMKHQYEVQSRSDCNKLLQVHGIDNRYAYFADRYPREEGVVVHWQGFPISVAFGALTAVALVAIFSRAYKALNSLIARRRELRGLCSKCKYDMRGSIASGRCPECGTVWDARMNATSMASSQSTA